MGGIKIKNIKFAGLILINIVICCFCMNFYSCQNISAQDFSPDDIANILEVILNKDNYTTNEKSGDEEANGDNGDNGESENNIDFTGDLTEPGSDVSQPGQSQSEENIEETPIISDDFDTTEPINIITEPLTEPDAPPVPVENTTEKSKPAETDDTNSNPYYSTGDATVINILNVFPGAPKKFIDIPYPESVPMIDSLKKNIKNLSGFSPRNFNRLSFYIATTAPELFTPVYGGGMLSDARRYRTEIVDAECNTMITSPNTFLEKSKETMIQDIRIALQADDFVADILCLPFDVQSELIRNGFLMNLKKTPFLNINAEYYNQSATEAFTVNGNIFGLVSDLTFDPSNIYAVFYNKTLVKKFNLTNPLDMYKNGEWNYDSMFNISKELTAAAANYDDPEGFVYYSVGIDREDSDIINGLFISSGGKYFSPRATYPSLSFANEKTNKIIDAISKIFSPQGESGISGFYNVSDELYPTDYMGSVLFSVTKLGVIPNITDSPFDWGILPVPSVDGIYQTETERKIYSSTSRDALCISVLKGTRNTEACGIVISALSSFSHQQLKDIYVIEQMRFHLRDVDSVIVLGDIINNINFNQYHAFSTMPEIYNSTAGILKDAANKKIDFKETHDYNKTTVSEFFRNSRFFDRS